MLSIKSILFIALFFLSFFNNYADYNKAQMFSFNRSECKVESSAGEYPDYTVIKNKKVIFKKEETASNVIFSSDGKYIAIGDTSIAPINIEKNNYHIAVINCQTEKVKGYLKVYEDLKIDKDGWRHFIDSASPVLFDNKKKQLKYKANIVTAKNKSTKIETVDMIIDFSADNILP